MSVVVTADDLGLSAGVTRGILEAHRRGIVRSTSLIVTFPAAQESAALAKDLKRRGWRFVGPTTVYAFMQAMGLVDDHLEGCDARGAVSKARKRFQRP